MNPALKAQRIKNIYYAVLAIIIAQLLYYPAEYKYFHLPLFILTLITVDLFNFEFRNYLNELIILFLLACSAFTAVADHFTGLNLKILYYFLMFISMGFVARIMVNMINIFSSGDDGKKHINDRNILLFRSNGLFMKIYGIVAVCIICTTFIYMLFDIIKIS